jgi:hypothetical protein
MTEPAQSLISFLGILLQFTAALLLPHVGHRLAAAGRKMIPATGTPAA